MITACHLIGASRFNPLKQGSIFNFVRIMAPGTLRYSTQVPSNQSLFSYTSGRFLFNEELRLKERCVPFNVAALYAAAEAAVGKEHGNVVHMTKVGEGGFNRVFTLGLEDGFEMVAKIPYHIAVPKYFATASEAATLTFLHSQGIPVPRVYGYCANAENPVRTEYILMEKAAGVRLKNKWHKMTQEEIGRLAHSFVQIETKLFETVFGATGSLYFKKDIPNQPQAALHKDQAAAKDDRYCLGPIADYMFWFGRRAGLRTSRGPWHSPVDYLYSLAQKEIEWTERYGEPMAPDFPHNTMGLGIQEPEECIKLLKSYQSLTPHVLPKDPLHLSNRPILRHPDPTPGNIYVSPETGRITCLIDWQHAIIQPQLLAAGYPHTFENPDDELPADLRFPELPEELSSLPLSQQQITLEMHRRRTLFQFYRIFNGNLNKPHLADLRDPLLSGRQMLIDIASRQWAGNLVTLKGAIVRMAQYWEHLPDVQGIDCPVKFDKAELEKFAETEDIWLKVSVYMAQCYDRVEGMTEEGWVSNEDYERAKKQLLEVEEEIWKACEGDEEDEESFRTGWPLRDREEVY